MFQETPVIQDKPSPNSQTEMDADENGREKLLKIKNVTRKVPDFELKPSTSSEFSYDKIHRPRSNVTREPILEDRSIGLDLMLHRSLYLKIDP